MIHFDMNQDSFSKNCPKFHSAAQIEALTHEGACAAMPALLGCSCAFGMLGQFCMMHI